LNRFGNVDSKFRFVILASKRAKQLLKGAKPKVKAKSRNPIRIAQSEVRAGVIEFEILPTQKEEYQEQEDRVFVGEGIRRGSRADDVVAGKEELVAETPSRDRRETETKAPRTTRKRTAPTRTSRTRLSALARGRGRRDHRDIIPGDEVRPRIPEDPGEPDDIAPLPFELQIIADGGFVQADDQPALSEKGPVLPVAKDRPQPEGFQYLRNRPGPGPRIRTPAGP
jgi:DNA-directed RNA polymerase omega subunit